MRRGNGRQQIRTVVDTNVFVSAFLYPHRPISQIVRYALLRRYRLLISPALVNELGRVMDESAGSDARVNRKKLKVLIRAAEIIIPKTALNVIEDDPPDNRILECAVEGKADVIVSGDRHLRRLKSYQGIPVVRPVDFLRMLGVL
jgi:putative PIN family toxin of toxin-antitoxin system